MNAKKLTILVSCTFLILYSISTFMFHDDFHDGWVSYEKKDYDTAYKLWLPLAIQGNPRAQFFLGVMFDRGQGISQDYSEAAKWYQRAAEQDSARAKSHIYEIAKKGSSQALKILNDDAKLGVVEAQVILGKMYEEGHPFPQDYNEAAKWYQRSAEQDSARAKSHIYEIAKKGSSQALKILNDDAKLGVVEAQLILGKMHENGVSVSQDYDQAFKWYQRAAEQDSAQAKSHIYGIAKKGSSQALKILTDDAKQGVAEAQFHLGLMYDKGQGVPQNYDQAFKWYQRAAKQGYGSRGANIYQIAKKGVAAALNVLTDDAQQGVVEAQLILGKMYEAGHQFPQDTDQAFKWYQRAAEQDSAQAKSHIYGIAKKGSSQALKILTADAEQGVVEAQFRLGK
ncbi:MAG: sel1 repeat family protein, partial [Nitrospina sp.]|nr:sel1 repeat family protein [Nitrospina sp.]